MTHNVKSELRRSMDAIHFSGDDKERMVALLMSAEAPRQRRSGKKLLLLALAATLVVGALTGAAVFTRWSRSAQTAYNPPQQVKEQAEKRPVRDAGGQAEGGSPRRGAQRHRSGHYYYGGAVHCG